MGAGEQERKYKEVPVGVNVSNPENNRGLTCGCHLSSSATQFKRTFDNDYQETLLDEPAVAPGEKRKLCKPLSASFFAFDEIVETALTTKPRKKSPEHHLCENDKQR